jgi:hypothetical protein
MDKYMILRYWKHEPKKMIIVKRGLNLNAALRHIQDPANETEFTFDAYTREE